MSSLNYILLITTIISVIGMIVVYIKRKNSGEIEKISELEKEIVENKKTIQSAESSISLIQEKNQKINQLSSSIENLNIEITNLKSQKKVIEQKEQSPATAFVGSLDDDLKIKLENKITQLEKAIKKLEEEVEDLEDEIDEKESLINNKIKEVNEVTETFKNEIETVNMQFEKERLALVEEKEKFNQLNNTINSANEFLKAKACDDQHTKTFYENVDNIYEFIDTKLIPKLGEFNELEPGQFERYRSINWTWANLQRKTWLKDKKVVAFVGEFSAGKTSIINRFITEDNPEGISLPISSKATTAIATYISPSDKNDNFQFADNNGVLKNIKKEVFESVKKDLFTTINISSYLRHFVITYKSIRQDKISILDTPGFSSNDNEDALRTANVIKEADLLFWVFDANSGEINRTSINTIKEHLKNVPLCIIINKVDTKSPSEVSQLEQHISKTLYENQISVESIIHFSQKKNLSELQDIIAKISPKKENEDQIKEIIAKLNEEIKESDEESNKAYSMRKETKYKLDIIEQNIRKNENYLESEVKNLVNIPEIKNANWFREESYKMDKDKYENFIKTIERITYLSTEIKKLNTQITEEKLREKIIINNDLYTKENNQYKELLQLEKDFNKLIDLWDPNFLYRL